MALQAQRECESLMALDNTIQAVRRNHTGQIHLLMSKEKLQLFNTSPSRNGTLANDCDPVVSKINFPNTK